MAKTNAELQKDYRRRSLDNGLVELQAFIEKDVHSLIGELAVKFNAPRYAVIEHAIKRLAESYGVEQRNQRRA